MTTVDDQGLVFAGVARQAQLVRDRQVSPRELVAHHLERIAQLDPVLGRRLDSPADIHYCILS